MNIMALAFKHSNFLFFYNNNGALVPNDNRNIASVIGQDTTTLYDEFSKLVDDNELNVR